MLLYLCAAKPGIFDLKSRNGLFRVIIIYLHVFDSPDKTYSGVSLTIRIDILLKDTDFIFNIDEKVLVTEILNIALFS